MSFDSYAQAANPKVEAPPCPIGGFAYDQSRPRHEQNFPKAFSDVIHVVAHLLMLPENSRVPRSRPVVVLPRRKLVSHFLSELVIIQILVSACPGLRRLDKFVFTLSQLALEHLARRTRHC